MTSVRFRTLCSQRNPKRMLIQHWFTHQATKPTTHHIHPRCGERKLYAPLGVHEQNRITYFEQGTSIPRSSSVNVACASQSHVPRWWRTDRGVQCAEYWRFVRFHLFLRRRTVGGSNAYTTMSGWHRRRARRGRCTAAAAAPVVVANDDDDATVKASNARRMNKSRVCARRASVASIIDCSNSSKHLFYLASLHIVPTFHPFFFFTIHSVLGTA